MEHDALTKRLLSYLHNAIRDFRMVEEDDRLAVAVSGGTDSLALLHLLSLYREEARYPFSLIAVHVPGDGLGPYPSGPHPNLTDHLEQSGVEFVFAPFPAVEEPPLSCDRCTRAKKKAIFLAAKEAGCGVVAFGHHADDMIETAVMNLILHSRLEGIQPLKTWFDDEVRVIRPLVYISKGPLERLGKRKAFPEPPPACPREETSSRAWIAQWVQIAQERFKCTGTNIYWAALKAMGCPVKKSGLRPPPLE